MKKYVLFASAILAFASCASDSFTGTDEAGRVAQGEKPISFGFDVPAATRAEGALAADKLNNQFIVYGEKGETDGTAPVTDGSTDHQLVFKNYVVNYTASTAYTTTSNTKDWEYVGLTQGYGTNVVPQAGETQTIKYWDYAATGYTFTAVSAKPDDISSGKVIINKLTSGSTVYDKGYTVAVTDMADLTSLYFADRVKIGDVAADRTGKDRTATNKYGGNVKFTFRNGMSQVRVGMYETIPGYDVKVTKFYYDKDATTDAAKPAFSEMTDGSTTNFVANVPSISPDVANSKTSVAGTFTVKYYDNTVASIENHPTISFTPTNATDSKQYITLGTNITSVDKLGVTSTAATYDTADGADTDSDPDYTTVFPQETNAKNLKLKIDYQLKNTITGEIINITGKTAEVPAQYLQWKPNFKYTYLFKINDNDLYPITFDAVVIEAENGEVEYITTVSEPSITTFGVNGGKYVHGGNEYAVGTDIYATIVQGSGVITPVLTGTPNAYVYTATCSDPAYITEAAVAEAIAEKAIGRVATPIITIADASASIAATVPGEDGKPITSLANKAILISPATAGYYVVAYKATAGSATATTAGYSATATYYSMTPDAKGFYPLVTTIPASDLNATSDGWADATAQAKYTTAPTQPVYVYKVIRVQ